MQYFRGLSHSLASLSGQLMSDRFYVKQELVRVIVVALIDVAVSTVVDVIATRVNDKCALILSFVNTLLNTL